MNEIENKEELFPVLCAGCEREGIRTVVNWSTVPNSHGSCPRHVREMWARTRKRRRILEEMEVASAAAKAMADREAASA
ncbi:MAG: hypothetical protein JRI34_02260 [Deltaproteobacteria bacterium]|nr:hypothetical protein [Deltaproteobacteria bacterium]